MVARRNLTETEGAMPKRRRRTECKRAMTKRENAMSALVFEHVPVADLPEKWRELLASPDETLVTVRIEAETRIVSPEQSVDDDPAFGIWRDRTDMTDVADYLKKVRQPRYNRGGSRNQP